MALAANPGQVSSRRTCQIGVSSKRTEPRLKELLAGAGLYMDRLNRDCRYRRGDRRRPPPPRAQQRAPRRSGSGTPSFIGGKFRVPGTLTMADSKWRSRGRERRKRAIRASNRGIGLVFETLGGAARAQHEGLRRGRLTRPQPEEGAIALLEDEATLSRNLFSTRS